MSGGYGTTVDGRPCKLCIRAQGFCHHHRHLRFEVEAEEYEDELDPDADVYEMTSPDRYGDRLADGFAMLDNDDDGGEW